MCSICFIYLQTIRVALQGVDAADYMLQGESLENILEVRLGIRKVSPDRAVVLRLDFLGCAEGKSLILS